MELLYDPSACILNITKEQKENILKMGKEGFSITDIVKNVGINKSLISFILKEINYRSPYQKMTNQDKQEVNEMLKDGISKKDIAEKIGINITNLNRYIRNTDPNYIFIPRKYTTEKNKEKIYKITPELKEKSIEMRTKGASIKNIAKEIGVSDSLIGMLLKKENIIIPKIKQEKQEINSTENICRELFDLKRKIFYLDDLIERNQKTNKKNKIRLEQKEKLQQVKIAKKIAENTAKINRNNKIIELDKNGISQIDIAKEIGINKCTVSAILRNNDSQYKSIRLVRTTNEQKEQIIEMRNKGMFLYDIEKEVGISQKTIINILKKANFEPSCTRTTTEQKEKIIEMWNKGISKYKIIDEVGLSRSTVK